MDFNTIKVRDRNDIGVDIATPGSERLALAQCVHLSHVPSLSFQFRFGSMRPGRNNALKIWHGKVGSRPMLDPPQSPHKARLNDFESATYFYLIVFAKININSLRNEFLFPS